jgi:lactate 2-monooxygenase
MSRYGQDLQERVYRKMGGNPGERLPVAVEEWERRAQVALSAGPYDYVAGAAGAEDTMQANLDAFARWRIRPRMLRNVADRDLTVPLFGRVSPVPFLIAPIGVNSILHPDAELAPARAAARAGVPYILSNVSTTPLEGVAQAMGEATRWFQLYPPRNKELSNSFLGRAEKAGYSAIVITLDSALLGWRERDLQNAYLPFLSGQGLGIYFTDPVFRTMLSEPPEKDQESAIRLALEEGNNVTCTWDGIEQIREQTRLPLLLKGITHPEDARMALERGIDGLVVSNHGGRQLGGAVATLDALPAICEVVNDRIPVLMDGGIRRGADVIKALALGARAVLLGRPWAYALAVAGEDGVREVIQNLIGDIDLHLALSGHKSVREVDRSLLVRVGG